MLHISGWYDDEQVGTPLNFIGASTKSDEGVRRSQRLLIGAWPHAINSTTKLGEVEFGPTAVIDINDYWLRWFDYWLKGIDNGVNKEAPVRIFVMGENVWRNENEWPIGRTKWTKYYLHSNGAANTLSGDGTLSTVEPALHFGWSCFAEPRQRLKSKPKEEVLLNGASYWPPGQIY